MQPIVTPGTGLRDEAIAPFGAGPFNWLQRLLPSGRGRTSRTRLHALVTAAVLWVPLAILSALEGHALSADPRESFLLDFSAYGRYLVAAPLLVIAASSYLPECAAVVRQFIAAEIIEDSDMPRYEALLASTRRLLDSRWTEVAMIAVAYVTTLVLTSIIYPRALSSWVAPIASGERHFSIAGWWRLLVSQPIFLTLGAACLWRVLLWARFLFALTRLKLRLIASHPDRLGGLRFMMVPLRGFSMLAFASGAIAASSVAEAVVFGSQPAADFKYLIGAQVLSVLIVFAGPYMVLSGRMIDLKNQGTLQYGWLATELGRRFETRWLESNERPTAEALAAADFSATTDLYSIAANVRNINPLVLDLQLLIPLAVATLLPYVPIVFLMMPVDQIVQLVLKTVI